jgi:hypothetical protein
VLNDIRKEKYIMVANLHINTFTCPFSLLLGTKAAIKLNLRALPFWVATVTDYKRELLV